MGRSVMTHSDAEEVVYIDGSDYSNEWEWEYFTDDLVEAIISKYPSFYAIDSWNHNEVHEILANSHCIISVSEYCGLISVSISPKEHDRYESAQANALALDWTKRNAKGIAKVLSENFTTLRRLGTFSNGEGVYERVTV